MCISVSIPSMHTWKNLSFNLTPLLDAEKSFPSELQPRLSTKRFPGLQELTGFENTLK